MNSSHKFRRRRVWKIAETAAFLKSWRSHTYLLRCLKKHDNKYPLFFAICKDLQKYGFKRSPTEIGYKIRNIRHKKKLLTPSWRKEIEEIEKMEKTELDQASASGPQTETTSVLFREPHVEGNDPESNEAVTTNISDDESDSDSDLSHTAKKHAKSKVLNSNQMSSPQLSGSHSKKSSETILLNICKEFRESNRQLEANDIAILKLFSEQNEIFRKQTRLLRELL